MNTMLMLCVRTDKNEPQELTTVEDFVTREIRKSLATCRNDMARLMFLQRTAKLLESKRGRLEQDEKYEITVRLVNEFIKEYDG